MSSSVDSLTVTTTRLHDALNSLADACRILEMEGHGDMSLGHLSWRDPDGRGFWLKRNRIGLGEVCGPEDFILVDFDGNQLEGAGGKHSEWPIHSQILLARPDINVVVHSHPFYASLWSASVETFEPVTLDADYFLAVPRHTDDVALVTAKDEGDALAAALGDNLAVLMANHGVTFCGRTVEEATCVGIFLEKAAKAQVISRAASLKTSFPATEIRSRRHKQIMTDRHIEHSWNFFRRKLAYRLNGASILYGSQA